MTTGAGDDPHRATLAERRARTRAAILRAARETFAENGYQKSTIRAVARRVGCDPALVMQHFGTKNALFRAATAVDIDARGAYAGPEDTRFERVLRHTFERMDDHADSIASTLRSMLTHDDIAEEALQLFSLPHPGDATPAAPEDPQAELRRELFKALTLGTAITRYVLKASAVENATLDDLLTCLLPAAEALQQVPATAPNTPKGRSS